MKRKKSPPSRLSRLRKIVPSLLAWYGAGHRDLPWRRTSDPYAVWLSEVMLQQTQVKKVLNYYEAFLGRFPTVESLASARESDVLKAWEGLGYYRRARHLHAAAKAVVAHGGWPTDAAGLEQLPGVGLSTAGAIASIAFGRPAPILDGNVKRVWGRLFALDVVPAGASLQPFWSLSEESVLLGRPGDVNQALMELGATVCTTRKPLCAACPVKANCTAFKTGEPERYPRPKARKARPLLDVSVALLWDGGRFLVTRRPEEGFLGGLWELPGGKWEPGEDGPAALRRELREELGIDLAILEAFPPIRHGYSHFEVRLHAFSCKPSGRRKIVSALPQRWILPSERHVLAFPRGTLKIFELAFPSGRAAAEEPSGWDVSGRS